MMYATNPAWRAMERLQRLTLKAQVKVLLRLISETRAPFDFLELGCGSAQISMALLAQLPKSAKVKYLGLDIDTGSLKLARLWSKEVSRKNLSIQFRNQNVFATKKFSAAIVLSLSNTLLSLGKLNQLKSLLKKLNQIHSTTYGIFSVVPTDKIRRDWHQRFTEGVTARDSEGEISLRVTATETAKNITQTYHLGEGVSVKHRYLSMSVSEIEALMQSCGWDILNWIEPAQPLGKGLRPRALNPRSTRIPEILIFCRSRPIDSTSK